MSVSGILIEGRPTTGKSTSLRDLPSKKTIFFTPNNKPLPFPGGSANYVIGENRFISSSLVQLKALLANLGKEKWKHIRYVVIEDLSHYMTNAQLDATFIASKDWGKWNTYAGNIFQVLKEVTETLPETIEAAILIHHTATDDKQIESFSSSGKLVDNLIKPASYFTYIYHSVVQEGDNGKREYLFQTNFAENREAKTPLGLHSDLYLPNNIMEIIKTIKNYENDEKPQEPQEPQETVTA